MPVRMKIFLTFSTILGAIGFPSSSAKADFSLNIQSTAASTITINDNNLPLGTNIDLNSALHSITGAALDLGNGISILTTTGTTNGLGGPKAASIQTMDFLIRYVGTGTKTITLTYYESAFTNPGTVGDELEFYSTADATLNGLTGKTTGVVHTEVINGADTIVGDSVEIPANAGASTMVMSEITKFTRNSGTFGVKNIVTITFNGAGEASFSTSSAVLLPAPASIVMAGSVLPIFAAFGWMRRRKATGDQVAIA